MEASKNGAAVDAELHVGESVLHMPIEEGTEGERAMDVSVVATGPLDIDRVRTALIASLAGAGVTGIAPDGHAHARTAS